MLCVFKLFPDMDQSFDTEQKLKKLTKPQKKQKMGIKSKHEQEKVRKQSVKTLQKVV